MSTVSYMKCRLAGQNSPFSGIAIRISGPSFLPLCTLVLTVCLP